MKRYLLMRLHGPLAAWGDIAVGERRGIYGQPSKSAVLGMVGAALGLDRHNEQALAELHRGYGFACKVERPGTLLTDYHTAQTAPAAKLKKRTVNTRRDELSIPRHELVTVLSSRDYLCDGVFAAALWAQEQAPHSLEEIAEALRKPVFALCLGRRSCPPSLPLNPQIVESASPTEALRSANFGDEYFLGPLGVGGETRYHWEGDASHLPPLETVRRRDVAGSRKLWQFSEREEHLAVEGN